MDFTLGYTVNLVDESGFMILVLHLRPHLGTRDQYLWGISLTKLKNRQLRNAFWTASIVAVRIVTGQVTELGRG